MKSSYRLGNAIVLGTVLASLAVCVLWSMRPQPAVARAGADLGNNPFPLGEFRLIERSGRAVTESDFAGRVAVVSFIFTRCPLSCPRISSVMKGLQETFTGTGVTLVSISVDPEHDTPEVLTEYARRFGAGADRWWFLTGPKPKVYELIQGRFKLGVQSNDGSDRPEGVEAISHSDRLALVDRGKVVGFFDSSDPEMIRTLVAEARRRDGGTVPPWVRQLPAVNAVLNGSCAVLLAIGWILVRARNYRMHAACMLAGVVVSALFLTSYLVYHFNVGSVSFRGVGTVRIAYFTVLLSHTLLATFGVVPLVGLTLAMAYRRQFDRHARIARLTFPIWMYVSITGVVIYLMLYQMPVAASGP